MRDWLKSLKASIGLETDETLGEMRDEFAQRALELGRQEDLPGDATRSLSSPVEIKERLRWVASKGYEGIPDIHQSGNGERDGVANDPIELPAQETQEPVKSIGELIEFANPQRKATGSAENDEQGKREQRRKA